MSVVEDDDMVRRRAIMTDDERHKLTHPEDVEDSRRYESISRIRGKIEELEEDFNIFRENHSGLYEDVMSVWLDELEANSDEIRDEYPELYERLCSVFSDESGQADE